MRATLLVGSRHTSPLPALDQGAGMQDEDNRSHGRMPLDHWDDMKRASLAWEPAFSTGLSASKLR